MEMSYSEMKQLDDRVTALEQVLSQLIEELKARGTIKVEKPKK